MILASKQHRKWQLNRVLQTADFMCSMGKWLLSEVILIIKGIKADSNLEAVLKEMGVEPTKVYYVGKEKAAGETILALAMAEDAKQKKGSCPVICDGHHKFLASWLAKVVGKVEVTPIVKEVPAEDAEAIARDANLAQRTGADLSNDEVLETIVWQRQKGLIKIQADLPFAKNDRGNHQKFWHRSEAIVNHGYTMDKVAKLEWQVCKALCDGVPYDKAILARAEKKNAVKVVTSETLKNIATIATNNDPEAKDPMTVILQKQVAGDNDGVKQAVSTYYAAKKNPA
jgi:hypothetical protein